MCIITEGDAMRLRKLLAGMSAVWLILLMSGCNLGDNRQLQPTAPPTNTAAATNTSQPIATDLAPTSIFVTSRADFTQVPPTAIIPPTAFIPPTATLDPTIPILLDGGRGIANGQVVNDGNFQVETYCSQLEQSWSIDEDGTDWFCTGANGSRVKTLTKSDFDNICQQTYDDNLAFAQQINNGDPAAYRWRCYGFPR